MFVVPPTITPTGVGVCVYMCVRSTPPIARDRPLPADAANERDLFVY